MVPQALSNLMANYLQATIFCTGGLIYNDLNIVFVQLLQYEFGLC